MRKILAVATAMVLMASGAVLAGASAASAATLDQMWNQSVGSPSTDAPCSTSSAEDLTAGWTQWAPSWEQWPSDGQGGWTCGRSILWDKGSSASDQGGSRTAAGCVLISNYQNPAEYMFFFPTNFLALAPNYQEGCTVPFPNPHVYRNFAYAPDLAEAQSLCPVGSLIQSIRERDAIYFQYGDNANVWTCDAD
jgi:hypothetical protein